MITITLNPNIKARIKVLDFYFEEMDIKGRSAQGNQVTKYPVKSIRFKEKGRSTLSAPKIWYDPAVGRLNKEEKGELLGRFDEKDRIIVFYKDGNYELTDFELTNRYDADNIMLIEKFKADKVVTAVYFDAKSNQFNAKRFLIESTTLKNKYNFIKDGEGNYLQFVTTVPEPVVIVKTGKKRQDMHDTEVALHETIDITGWRTIGTRIAGDDLRDITMEMPVTEENAEPDAPTLF